MRDLARPDKTRNLDLNKTPGTRKDPRRIGMFGFDIGHDKGRDHGHHFSQQAQS